MTDTNLSGVEIAQLVATITGGGYKRAKSKEAAIGRFMNIANGAKIPAAKAEAILGAETFEKAQNLLAKQLNKPAKETAPKAPRQKTAKVVKPTRKAEAEATARAGHVPPAPDFSAETHKSHRKRLAEVVALVEARKLKELKALKLETHTSSRKAIARYRNLAVMALEAKSA
ncbi:hypothetical protein MAUB1S_11453 [Mycolicibacterium aubagnense]